MVSLCSTQPCHRCDQLAENPQLLKDKIFGKWRPCIVLCLDCLSLMFDNNPRFMTEGWARYRPGGRPA